MKTLNKSMVDYIDDQYLNFDFHDLHELIFKYARFLQKPLKLEYFVPCDDDGDRIILSERGDKDEFERVKEQNLYKEAEQKVLFKGFYDDGLIKHEGGSFHIIYPSLSFYTPVGGHLDIKTIEDLIPYNLELTETAKKMIGI